MRWRDIDTSKKKDFLLTGLVLAGFLLINVYIIHNMLDYCSMKTKSELSQEELANIREEYHLSDDAQIEYVCSQGRDVSGIRIRLTGVNDSTDIYSIANSIFDCNIIYDSENGADKTFRYYSEHGKVLQWKSSAGIVNYSISMQDYLAQFNELTDKYFRALLFFEEGGNWYIEIYARYG